MCIHPPAVPPAHPLPPEPTHHSEVTRLLAHLGRAPEEDTDSRERLFALVYAELRRTAGGLMARERAGHTLQPTALVHEAYLRLVDQDGIEWTGRAHFLGVAARSMRQILVDHARARTAQKRGGGEINLTLEDDLVAGHDRQFELLELNDALEKLARLDERASRVAEMRLFAGMTVEEVSRALGVSRRTVDGDWATARAWLGRELGS